MTASKKGGKYYQGWDKENEEFNQSLTQSQVYWEVLEGVNIFFDIRVKI